VISADLNENTDEAEFEKSLKQFEQRLTFQNSSSKRKLKPNIDQDWINRIKK